MEHISRHDYSPEEVEEIFVGRHKIRRSRSGTYVALGRTLDGRMTLVVYLRLPGRTIRVVTARDMNDWERRMYDRK